jgi:hypothetical protein
VSSVKGIWTSFWVQTRPTIARSVSRRFLITEDTGSILGQSTWELGGRRGSARGFPSTTWLLSFQNHSTSATYSSLIGRERGRNLEDLQNKVMFIGITGKFWIENYLTFIPAFKFVIMRWWWARRVDGVYLAGGNRSTGNGAWEWSLSQDHIFYQKFQIEFSVIEIRFWFYFIFFSSLRWHLVLLRLTSHFTLT